MKKITLKFGLVNVELYLDKKLEYLYTFFSDWFRYRDDFNNIKTNTDVIFHLISQSKLLSNNVKLRPKTLSYWDERAWLVFIQKQNPANWKITCVPKFSRRMSVVRYFPSFFIRPLFNDAPTFKYLQASYFLYNILIPIVQSILLTKGCTFIHAASVCSVKGSYLFSGLGGAGKTSASSYLYLKESDVYNCLGDDFSIISETGIVYPNPMPMNVYPYNIKSFPELKKYLLTSMSFSEKFYWKVRSFLFGSKAAMKRIALPKTTVDCQNTELNTVFHLERWGGETFKIKELKPREFSTIAKNILLYEFKDKQKLFASANLSSEINKTFNIPSIDQMGLKAEEIYMKACRNKKIIKILVPENINIIELGEFIRKLISEDNNIVK
uniref:HPr kinase n=1 Tax=Thermodesulfobacterium geofontis TaxID=1295609 RepID=A0A7V5XGD3_9BACT